MSIELPLSKSIANRLMLLQAIQGDELMSVTLDMPDDVRLIHKVLSAPRTGDLAFCLDNCGTAMRFLTAYFADEACCRTSGVVTLTGLKRMYERPIGQLVDVLRQLGADIAYVDREGYPPLRITPRPLSAAPVSLPRPESTQYVSALLLTGHKVLTDSHSPYIDMTRAVMRTYAQAPASVRPERCWSSAAFWYEYVALHGGELRLDGLTLPSLQGDSRVAELYERFFGVHTRVEEDGVVLQHDPAAVLPAEAAISFADVPDLYPAVALTSERLGIRLLASGTEALPLKESNRLLSVEQHDVANDHRMAMALLAADYPLLPSDCTCVSKSYPAFCEQLSALCRIAHIIPVRGLNDEGQGKKHALSKLVKESKAPYIWLHDDDVLLPTPTEQQALERMGDTDLLILPLRMRSQSDRPSLLERLQMAEYAAIQQLTIESARRGRAVMCSGANLLVKRDVWLRSEADLHPELPSGDDMFLLESVKRQGGRVAVCDESSMEATVYPLSSWRSFWRQRMRWAGKAPAYADRDIRRMGVLVVLLNVLQVLFPPVLLVKFPLEWGMIRRREPNTSLWVALLLELVYPFYMIVCLVGGLCSGRKSRTW